MVVECRSYRRLHSSSIEDNVCYVDGECFPRPAHWYLDDPVMSSIWERLGNLEKAMVVQHSDNFNVHHEIAESGKTYAQLTDYSDVPKGESHYRMCYFAAKDLWRLRDERGSRRDLWLVKDYLGTPVLNWQDGGSHLFADNPVWVDSEAQIAHFYLPGQECECGRRHDNT